MKLDSEPDIIDGAGAETGQVIRTIVGGRGGQSRQTVSYISEHVVGTGSFGVIFQAKCRETREIVAIKKVLQDKRYKNWELQIMQMLDHPNIVSLKHCFFSTTDKEDVYLNLVLEFVLETVYRIARNYSRINQRMPLIYVKLCTYQICRALAYIHNGIGICHRDIKPQNLLVNPHTHQLKLCDFGSAKVLSEPDRIVRELLQPGGYLKLIELGLEDCANESIDAQKVFGYALYKDGKDTTLSYPLGKYSSDVARRSFHNGRFIQRMR